MRHSFRKSVSSEPTSIHSLPGEDGVMSTSNRRENKLLGPAILLLARLFVQLGGPIVGLLTVRYLGPEQYGWYASATALTGLMSVWSVFGFHQGILRMSADLGRQELPMILRAAFRMGILFLVLTYAAIAVWLILGSYRHEVVLLVCILCIDILRTTVVAILTAGLQAGGQYARIGVWEFAYSAVLWFGTLGAMALGGSVYTVVALPRLLGLLVSLGMFIRVGSSVGLFGRVTGRNRVSFRQVWSNSWEFGVSSVAYQTYHQADSAIMSTLRSTAEVGQYSVARKLFDLCGFVPAVVFNMVLYPKYYEWRADYRERLQHYYIMMTKTMTLIGTVAAVVFGFLARDIIGLLFGAGYHQASELLLIVVWAFPLYCWASSAGAVLTTDGKVMAKTISQSIVGVCSSVLNIWLLPNYGAAASAIIMMASYLVLSLLYSWQVSRLSNISLAQSKSDLAVISLVASVVCALSLILRQRPLVFRLIGLCSSLVSLLLTAWITTSRAEVLEIRRLVGMSSSQR